ncbi:MAG: class II aldolase/adducin family protein [Ignavibacteriaceae bacterium]|nr:class II aldolase/adducin family protein [Ignavibacteriaceae bacterium]
MQDREKLISICHKVYKKGFVAATDGNVSAITSNNTILITRSGICKGDVTVSDILEFDFNGKPLKGEGRITTEFKLHLYAYSKRKDVNAVVHCHPVYSTAFSMQGEGLVKHYFPEVILTLGAVPLCRYGTPSTEDLPLSLDPHINYAWAFLLENHGALTLGKNLDDAYYKMEKLEHAAKTLFKAKILGNAKELSKDDIRKLLEISEETYGITQDPRNVLD